MKKNRAIIAGVVAILIVIGLRYSNFQSSISKNEASNSSKITFRPSDWQLILVNKQHPLSSEYSFDQTSLDGQVFDKRIINAVNQFRSAASEAGYSTTVVSGYRSIADQTDVYNTSVDKYINQGMTKQEAETETQKTIQTPGSSEHATGLAIDLADNQALADHPELSASMEDYKGQQWLIKNAAKYGFILRYPSGNQAKKTTGIDYEPWHFRYVGKDAAAYINKNNLTLEEFNKEIKK